MDESSQILAFSLLPSSSITPHSFPPSAITETHSSPLSSSDLSAIKFITLSSSELTNILITPPATPPKMNKAANRKTSSQSTPNRVGKILRKFYNKATLTVSPKRKMLSIIFAQEEADADERLMDVLMKKYIEFVTRHPEIKKIDDKSANQNMGCCIHVASYIPLSPSPTAPIINQEMMALLFARDLKYIFS